MNSLDNEPFIDVERAIGTKNPQLLKWLPRFFLNYIKRLVRQDDLNDFVVRNRHLDTFAFAHGIVEVFGPVVSYEGLENVPSSGGAIIASNHPLGGLDAMALVDVVATRRKDIRFVVNDILLQIKNLNEIFIGVNKHGRNKLDTLQSMDDVYNSGKLVMIFPAGLVSRKQSHGIMDLEWKKSFITRARRHRLDVIPVYIEAKNTNKFYNFARWREKLGFKSNIEMILLPSEMYYQKGKSIRIIFGKPIPCQHFDKSRSDMEWAAEIKDIVYQLKQ